MKNRATTGFLKQAIAALVSVAKDKLVAVKSKTRSMKTRLIIFSLLMTDKKVLVGSISNKLQALVGLGGQEKQQHVKGELECSDGDGHSNDVVLYNDYTGCSSIAANIPLHVEEMVDQKAAAEEDCGLNLEDDDDDDDDEGHNKYPDLTLTLFDLDFEDKDETGVGGSVIEMVRNCKEVQGEEFRLEDEIDQVADLFIRRFHRQMRMQKQHSFKLYQDMFQRSL